jgi:glycosyltransferase involved in cell wall biosynthesis
MTVQSFDTAVIARKISGLDRYSACIATSVETVHYATSSSFSRWNQVSAVCTIPGGKMIREVKQYPHTTAPLISFIIPFFRHGEFLAETVRSIEEQNYSPSEIIIVDDGSPIPVDAFLPKEHSLTIIRTENAGVSAARNRGFRESSGSYILFIDADDRLMPGAINSHLKVFADYPDTQLTFGACRFIDDSGTVTRRSKVCRERQDYFRMFLESNPIGGPGSCLMRRSLFAGSGGFREGKATAEDYDLWLRMARIGKIRRHTECILEYRIHSNNVSGNSESMLAGTMETLDRLEATLNSKELARLKWARRRWIHLFRPRPGVLYRVEGMIFSLRAMLDVPLSSYGRELRMILIRPIISLFGD